MNLPRLASAYLLVLSLAATAFAADLTATFVTGGATHNLFLKSDKTLWGMGWNLSYELGDGTTTRRPTPILIATDVVSAAGGEGHTMFVKSDGTLWGTGGNSRGQLGNGTTGTRTTPAQIATGVALVAAGARHTLFIKSDYTLWAMGDNQYGQLGNGNRINQSTPVLVATDVASVSAKNYHTMFVKRDGSLWGMGLNNYGQLGNGSDLTPAAPVQIVTGVASVSAAYDHTTFVKTDGTVWVTGFQSSGRLGDGVTGTAYRTVPLQIDTGVISASAGDAHTMFVKSNQQRTETSLWATGSNIRGQLGLGNTTSRSTPIRVLNGALMVFAGNGTTFYITLDGSLWAMGYNENGQLGDGTTTNRTSPVLIFGSGAAGGPNQAPTDILLSNNVVYQNAGNNAVVGTLSTVDPDSTTFTYELVAGTGSAQNATFAISGSNLIARNSLPAGPYSIRVQSTDSAGATFAKIFNILFAAPPPISAGSASFAGGGNHSLFVQSGQLWTTGFNTYGQLGDGSLTLRTSPVQITTGVAAVAAGQDDFSAFVKTDGSLWTMGRNNVGNLGDGTTGNRSSPVQIATGVATAAAGVSFTAFVRTNGSLWTTGWNNYGQLGTGTLVDRLTPIQVVPAGVTAVAAGASHLLHVRTDGTLWANGWNAYGQLGTGNTTDRNTPVQVATGVTAVAAGYGHSAFVRTDRTLWEVGWDSTVPSVGGVTANRLTPVQIADSVAAVAAGGYHTVFIRTDGTLWGRGNNASGQLGDGTLVNRSTPVQIATEVVAVAAGTYHTFFKKNDGSIWAMGSNGGNLGDGTAVSRRIPVRITLGAANDTFANAVALAGASGQVAGTTTGATRDGTDPTVGGLSLSASVWYRWTAPASGNVTFRLAGSASGTGNLLAVYSGTTAGALTQVAADTLAGAVTVNAVGGTVYHVMVDRWSGGAGPTFTLAWEQTSSPTVPPAASGLAYLSNLSVLARAGTQSETLTAGLTVGGGTGGKSVLIRGIGPTLSAFGVGNALADPTLTVTRNNVRLSVNDDWAGTDIPAAAAAVGAFALPAASRDAAILAPGFTAGGYVISLEGKNNAVGTALIEVYDTTAAGTMTAASPRFTNIAARTFGGTGTETLIVGFSIAGTGTLRVLVRASGPGLAPFGLTGLMPDPKLELYSGNTKISENDNWDAATLPTQNSVGAFPFPASSRDAVLVATLTPGSYTAQVVAQGGNGGVALLELYEIP